MSVSKISNPSSTEIVVYEPFSVSAQVKKVDFAFRRQVKIQYLDTYKALHLGGKETLESRMIRLAIIASPTHSEEEMMCRYANYNIANRHLSNLTDDQIAKLLTNARVLGSGIGGDVLAMEVEGVTVFIKKIPLTEIEQQNPRSTLNLFELPPNYQYGVGSMGFGVWRELSTHEITTKWVLNGECQNFPLMYHARALQRSTPPATLTKEDAQNKQRYIAYWDGATAVGERADAVATASADVVVFMEYLPQTLAKGLSRGGNSHAGPDMARIEYELFKVCAFMKSQGFLHFDAHLHNILCTNHIYFADFGLAMHQGFQLSSQEIDFFEKHVDYDRSYVASALARGAIDATLGIGKSKLVLDTYRSTGKIDTALPSAITSIVHRYLPVADVMEDFFCSLQEKSKSTPFPEEALARAWDQL